MHQVTSTTTAEEIAAMAHSPMTDVVVRFLIIVIVTAFEVFILGSIKTK